MKKIYSLLIIAALVASCGGNKKQSTDDVIVTGNLETIRTKRSEIVAQQKTFKEELTKLDAAIAKLDLNKRTPLITTIAAKHEVFNHYIELQGNVSTKNLLVLYPEHSGILTRVYVKEGQQVSKGQTLAKIDDGGMSQQLAQVKIQADLAKTTFERQERLWNQKIGSEMQFLQAKSNYQAQEEMVNQMKQQVAKTIVRAPFSGVIDEVISEQGSVVGAGQSQLIRIVNLRNMYIETDVPESYIAKVTKNKDVLVEFPILGTKLDAKIRQAGSYINPSNRTFRIEIGIPNADKNIKPNLTARLKINDYTNESAILLPQSIISENAEGQQYVYILKDKNANNEAVAEKTVITTGQTQGDVIEVLEGLKDGDEIVNEGARSVKNGQKVKVISE